MANKILKSIAFPGVPNVYKIPPQANEFSSSSTYVKDSYVTYQGVLYKCINAITTAGSWTGSANWIEVQIANELQNYVSDLQNSIDDIISSEISQYQGATEVSAGVEGYIPGAELGNTNSFFRSDGTWSNEYVKDYVTAGRKSGTTLGSNATVEGSENSSTGQYSHSEGYSVTSAGLATHAEGVSTFALTNGAHAEGELTQALRSSSHAEGYNTTAQGDYSHAEGSYTYAGIITADAAHAEGISTAARLSGSHAEGKYTLANNNYSHAEGGGTSLLWSGTLSHVAYSHDFTVSPSIQAARISKIINKDNVLLRINNDFYKITNCTETTITISETLSASYTNKEASINEYTVALGESSHAEGQFTIASGNYSHAEGSYTVAKHLSQHVFGQNNIEDPSQASSTARGTYIEIVGNGTSTSARSNARTLDWNGNEILSGKLTVGAAPTNNMDVATKQYVDSIAGNSVLLGTISFTTSWTQASTGIYTQTVTVSGFTVTSTSKIDLQPTAAQIASLISSGVNSLVIENNNGTLTAYAVGAATTAMTVQCTATEVS